MVGVICKTSFFHPVKLHSNSDTMAVDRLNDSETCCGCELDAGMILVLLAFHAGPQPRHDTRRHDTPCLQNLNADV